MQAYNHRRYGRSAALLMIAPCLYLYAHGYQKMGAASQSQETINQATINHVIDGVEPLCRTFVPHQNQLRFNAQPAHSFHRSGSPRNLWAVDCFSSTGKDLVHVLWDEDNRRCVSISQLPENDPPASGRKLPQEKVLLLAREWVARLNIADELQAAHAASKLRRFENSYRVFLNLPEGMATVWIDARTGEAFNVLVKNYPDASTMQAASFPENRNVPHS